MRVSSLTVPLALCCTWCAPVLAASGPTSKPAAGWVVVGQPGITGQQVMCCQMAFNSKNVPHIAFKDYRAGGRASVMRLAGDTWQPLGPPGAASLGSAWYCRLAFDRRDRLYLVSRDYGARGDGHVVMFDPAAKEPRWIDVGPSSAVSPMATHWTDIAVSSTGVPYVAFADRRTNPEGKKPTDPNDDRATVVRVVAGKWLTVGPMGFSPAAARFPSIALGPGDVPYVAYQCRRQGGKLSVMKFDTPTSGWGYVGKPGCSAKQMSNPVIRIDAKGVPHAAFICHADGAMRYEVRVLRFNGAKWTRVGGAASGDDYATLQTEGWRQWISLDFDRAGRPCVAYQVGRARGAKAAVRRFDGKAWMPLGALGFTPAAADYLAMACDTTGGPWIVFRDGAHGQSVTVMKYTGK